MSYLTFTPRPSSPKRKTLIFDVIGTKGENLGVAAFFPKWRKFVCEIQAGIVFDSGCYRELADFLDAQTNNWKASRDTNNPA